MPDSYDSVPYPSYAYAATHPDTLCTLGRLFGLSPAPPQACRVLELGCASGGNLISMAELLPGSELLGFDRSRVQIERGRALIAELGLGNVRIEHADIMSLDPRAIGKFDYVICHGVFAWVPRRVQDRILALTAAALQPRGLAFISYNVYPGWHTHEMVRRMMLYHLRGFKQPGKRIEQARALIDFVAGAVTPHTERDDPRAALLGKQLEAVRKMSDAYLFHEYLERDNSPLYFHEFIDRLHSVPLRYLCDTDLNLMVARDMPEQVRETLARIAGDQVSMEQYLDFVRNRQFRTSVLCRIEAAPQRRLQPERIESLRLTMAAKPKAEAPALEPGVELGFACASGAQISSPEPLTKAALLELCARWPGTIEFEALVEAAHARTREAGVVLEPDRRALAADLIECLLRKAVIARSFEPPVATTVPDKPKLSAFSRLVAAREGWVCTLHHHRIDVAAPLQKLALLLDGTRDRAALLAEIGALIEAGELSIRTKDGRPIEGGGELLEASATFLDEQLARLLDLPALLRA